MTLTDAGPLVALIDAADNNHEPCLNALPGLQPPLITTWPCLTEAMYLVGKYGGYRDQERLWTMVDTGAIVLHSQSDTERIRMRALMQMYRDVPMDFADASLVAAAEKLVMSRIFTTDSHFRASLINNQTAFTVVP